MIKKTNMERRVVALKLLHALANVKGSEISLYDLINRINEKWEEDKYEEYFKAIYYLSARHLVSLKTIDGEDGEEISVKLTPFGEKFLKVEKKITFSR